MTSLTETVAANGDDGHYDDNPMGVSTLYGEDYVSVGHDGSMTPTRPFVRFDAVDLEAEFTIASAKLQFILYENNSSEFDTKIRVDLNSNADLLRMQMAMPRRQLH